MFERAAAQLDERQSPRPLLAEALVALTGQTMAANTCRRRATVMIRAESSQAGCPARWDFENEPI